jgi:hypothetical protein
VVNSLLARYRDGGAILHSWLPDVLPFWISKRLPDLFWSRPIAHRSAVQLYLTIFIRFHTSIDLLLAAASSSLTALKACKGSSLRSSYQSCYPYTQLALRQTSQTQLPPTN